MISIEPVKMFFQEHPGFFLLLFLASAVSLLAVYVYRLEHPLNLILLATFTLFESLTMGTIVSFFDKMLVIQAVIITATVVVGLTAYTFQTKRDFSELGAGLFAMLCIFIGAGLIQVRIDTRNQRCSKHSFGLFRFSFVVHGWNWQWPWAVR